MGITHPSIDIGAEADALREAIAQFETVITSDEHNNQINVTTIDYVSGEGDPPFVKYRITLEAVGLLSPEQYLKLQEDKKAKAAE